MQLYSLKHKRNCCLGVCSVAIIQYLAGTFNTKDHWYPKENKTRARVDEYLAWHQGNLRKTSFEWIHHEVVDPMVTKQPVEDAVKSRTLTAEYDKSLGMFVCLFI